MGLRLCRCSCLLPVHIKHLELNSQPQNIDFRCHQKLKLSHLYCPRLKTPLERAYNLQYLFLGLPIHQKLLAQQPLRHKTRDFQYLDLDWQQQSDCSKEKNQYLQEEKIESFNYYPRKSSSGKDTFLFSSAILRYPSNNALE